MTRAVAIVAFWLSIVMTFLNLFLSSLCTTLPWNNAPILNTLFVFESIILIPLLLVMSIKTLGFSRAGQPTMNHPSKPTQNFMIIGVIVLLGWLLFFGLIYSLAGLR
jgi:hypothetical protein